MIAETTLPWRLIERASEDGPRPALEAHVNGAFRVYTWAEVLAEVSWVALGLQQLGFRAGDGLAVFDVRRAHLLFTMLAVQALGGSVLPLEARISRFELRSAFRGRPAQFGFADDAQHLERLLELDPPAFARIVFDDRIMAREYATDVITSYDAVREAGARHGRTALGQFAVLAGRVAPATTAFEFLESGPAAQVRALVSHAGVLGAAQRTRRSADRSATAVSPRLSSTHHSMLATVAWLEHGFTVLTMEAGTLDVGLPESDEFLACRSSPSRRGARSAAAR